MRRPVSGKCRKPAVSEPDILNLNELRIPNHHAVEPQLNVLGVRAAPFDDGPPVHLAAKIIKNVSRPVPGTSTSASAQRSISVMKQSVCFKERPTTTVRGWGRGPDLSICPLTSKGRSAAPRQRTARCVEPRSSR